MDETGTDYTEWSKSERKTQIQYTNAYIWNLERCSMLGAGAWGWPREMLWGGMWKGGSCLGTHVRIKDFKI